MSTAQKINTDVSYKKIIEKVNELPTLPTIISEIIAIINDPMSSVKDLEDVILKDQSITTKILKLINSAYYSIQGGVKDLGRAIAYLGFDAVYQLVLSTAVIESLNVKESDSFNIIDFWQHSVGVAMTAETIAKHFHIPKPHECFTAGLIHDIGKLALVKVDPELLVSISQLAKESKKSFNTVELENNLPRHTIIGSILAEKWKFPANLSAAIKYHHTIDRESRFNVTNDIHVVVDIVGYSNFLMHSVKFGNSGHCVATAEDNVMGERIGINSDNLKPLGGQIRTCLKSANQFLEIIRGQQ
jgi:putative nucleotidyltransferase with HDIG domain